MCVGERDRARKGKRERGTETEGLMENRERVRRMEKHMVCWSFCLRGSDGDDDHPDTGFDA